MSLQLLIVGVNFELNGMACTNNSATSLLKVGEGENALLCKTIMKELTIICLIFVLLEVSRFS